MSFRERWIALLHRAATGTRRTRSLLTPIGVAIFGMVVATFIAAALLVDSLLGLPGLLPESARRLVSLPLIGLGGLVTLWSAAHFLNAKGTPVPFNPPPTLVTSGPYRYARNPMLAGVFLILLGLGLLLGSPTLVVVFVPLFVAINVWELRRIEEPELVQRLGDEYIEYRRRTPMFLPRLWRWRS